MKRDRRFYTLIGQARRERIMAAIQDLVAAGHVPTMREIGKRCGLTSSATVNTHCRILVGLGKLRRLESVDGGVVVYFPIHISTGCPHGP